MKGRTRSTACFLAAAVSLFLAACTKVEMHDVSADAEHAPLIGREIRLKEDVWALGTAWNYKPPADHVLLEGGVGFAGREVVSRSRMKKDTVLRIRKVLAAKPLGLLRVSYVVDEVNTHAFTGEQLEIRLVAERIGATPHLPGQYFELLDPRE